MEAIVKVMLRVTLYSKAPRVRLIVSAVDVGSDGEIYDGDTIASSSVVIELQGNARTLSVAPVSVMSVEHFLLVTYDERIGFGMTVIWIEY